MKINVVKSVLDANASVAKNNRNRLDKESILCINIMSSPGSGKTTLLEATLPILSNEGNSAILVGDLQTSRDAERLGSVCEEVTQINTGGGCHLSAPQVAKGLDTLNLDEMAYLFIENVGNLVCPAAFELGEHKRVVLLSVTEGDDKVAKYPTMFQPADLILLTKIDLLGVVDFEIDRVKDDLKELNTRAPFIEFSSKSGQGMDTWIAWLKRWRKDL